METLLSITEADATMMGLFFSIIIPCYNAEVFIARAIESALVQDGTDFEIIVVDDGSTDDTHAILQRFTETHGDRFVYYNQANKGPAAARNAGAAEAKGQYLLFLDADDELLPNALQVFRAAIKESDGQFDFIFAGHYSVSMEGKAKRLCPPAKTIDRYRDFKQLILGKGVSPTQGAIVIRKECFQVVSYPETIRCNEDFVLFAQLIALFTGKSISQPVLRKYKRVGSLRSDRQSIDNALQKAPDLLFNPSVLPPVYLHLKPLYKSKRYLEKARVHFKDNEFHEFRRIYHQAIRVYPLVIFMPKFLRRYFVAFMKTPRSGR